MRLEQHRTTHPRLISHHFFTRSLDIAHRRILPAQLQVEYEALEKIAHPNVVHLVTHGPDPRPDRDLYYIFMEAADGGELFDRVMKNVLLTEAEAGPLFCQMASAVAAAHRAGVAHRDLKLENFVLTRSGDIKLIDFGLSHIYEVDEETGEVDRSVPLHNVSGSKAYAAPETFNAPDQGYDGFEADIWSLGICLFAMLSGSFPVPRPGVTTPLSRMLVDAKKGAPSPPGTTGDVTNTFQHWHKRTLPPFSPELISLIDGLLHFNPSLRLSAEQVEYHPWTVEYRRHHLAKCAPNKTLMPASIIGVVSSSSSTTGVVSSSSSCESLPPIATGSLDLWRMRADASSPVSTGGHEVASTQGSPLVDRLSHSSSPSASPGRSSRRVIKPASRRRHSKRQSTLSSGRAAATGLGGQDPLLNMETLAQQHPIH